MLSSNSTSEYTPQKTEDKYLFLKRYLNMHVHRCIIYNSQKAEATQVSTDRWTDKQNMVLYTMDYYQPLKSRKFWHMLQYGWTLRTWC